MNSLKKEQKNNITNYPNWKNRLTSITLVSILIISTLIVTIKVANAEEWSTPPQLTSNNVFDGFPVISGDGTKIAFTSNVDGDPEIHVINLEPIPLVSELEPTLEPTLATFQIDIIFSALSGLFAATAIIGILLLRKKIKKNLLNC